MSLVLSFTDEGWEDYQHWVVKDRSLLKRVNTIIEAALRDPEGGIGKPEPLRGNLSGYLSRRISDEHRLVYTVAEQKFLVVVQARYHY